MERCRNPGARTGSHDRAGCGRRLRRTPLRGLVLLLAVLCIAVPGAARASDVACRDKPYKDCIGDLWPLVGWPARFVSWMAAGAFGGQPIGDIESDTVKRWYGTDIYNDFLLKPIYTLGSGDGFFTGGFKYQYLFVADEPSRIAGRHVIQNAGMAVALEVYTASDITQQIDPDNPPPYERPYASLFTIGSVYEVIEAVNEPTGWWLPGEQFLRFELDLSLTGPYSPGGSAQTTIHDTLANGRTPQGWDSQIGTQLGVELDGLYGYELVGGGSWARFVNLILTTRGRLGGVYRDASIGARTFIAIYGAGGWFERAIVPETLLGTPLGVKPDGHGLGWSLTFAYERRYVALNALLEGGRWERAPRSPHTVRAKRYVNRFDQGFTVALCDWRLSYDRTLLTGEIDHRLATDPVGHRYGTLSIVYEKNY